MPRKARARMLSPTISVSERVNQLSLEAALVYTWLLPHCDDMGRMSGKPATIKGMVVPLRDDITIEHIKRALREMEEVGLIKLYRESEVYPHGSLIIQVVDWWDFQQLREPQPSRYPPPEGWQDRVGHQTRDELGRFGR